MMNRQQTELCKVHKPPQNKSNLDQSVGKMRNENKERTIKRLSSPIGEYIRDLTPHGP